MRRQGLLAAVSASGLRLNTAADHAAARAAQDKRNYGRKWGRAFRGKRTTTCAVFVRGKRFSLVPVLSYYGLLDWYIVEGGLDASLGLAVQFHRAGAPQDSLALEALERASSAEEREAAWRPPHVVAVKRLVRGRSAGFKLRLGPQHRCTAGLLAARAPPHHLLYARVVPVSHGAVLEHEACQRLGVRRGGLASGRSLAGLVGQRVLGKQPLRLRPLRHGTASATGGGRGAAGHRTRQTRRTASAEFTALARRSEGLRKTKYTNATALSHKSTVGSDAPHAPHRRYVNIGDNRQEAPPR